MSTVNVRNGQFSTEVVEQGSGSPLLYLHGIAGPRDSVLIEKLAANHRVIAPVHPGFGASTGDEHLTDLFDLLYYYLDFMDTLELRDLALVGHSLGGMFAAELAAMQPERFSKLVLIAPYGLWNSDVPVMDYFVASPDEQAAALFADASTAAAQEVLAAPANEGDVAALLEKVKAQRVAAKYLWPLPNRGLARRMHRVHVPTLVLWGEDDGANPVAYAEEFRSRLPDARVERIANAGHMVTVEQPDATAQAIEAFV